MITVNEVMPMLAKACPSFKETYDGLIAFHGEPIPVLLMDDFADHVFYLYEDGDVDSLTEVFKVIEEIKSNGDEEAKELVMTCFFGEIDNLVAKRKLIR